MHVAKSEGWIELQPSSDAEEKALVEFFDGIESGTMLNYKGRKKDHLHPGLCGPIFSFGEKELTILGTTEEDGRKAFSIRDYCFWGRPDSVIFQGQSGVGLELVVCLSQSVPCKHCGKPCTKIGEAQSETCTECQSRCHHEWEEAVVANGQTQSIEMAQVCKRCGAIQGDPDTESMSPSERVRAVLDAGFLDAVIIRNEHGDIINSVV